MELTLPYDCSMENAVLGAIIRYPEEYDVVSKYFSNDEVFYQDKARLLWRKLKKIINQKEKVDMIAISSSLTKKEVNKGLTAYYITLCYGEAPAKGGTSYYATLLYEKYLLRQVIVSSEKVKEKAKENNVDVYSAINEAHTLYGELLESRPSKVQDIEDVISDTLTSIKNKTTKGPINGEQYFVEDSVRERLNLKLLPCSWFTRWTTGDLINKVNKIDWQTQITTKYREVTGNEYIYLGDKFHSDIKMVHFTHSMNKPHEWIDYDKHI